MNDEEIVYSLNIDDVQTVAKEEIKRTLHRKEIEIIADSIAEKIGWYDAIAEAIHQYFSDEHIIQN